MNYITPKHLEEKQNSGEAIVVIDVREPYEVDICRIESIHIPMAEVPERLNDIPVEGEVVIMCKSGKRALAVANLLESDHGRQNVVILDGGIMAWIEQIDNQLEVY